MWLIRTSVGPQAKKPLGSGTMIGRGVVAATARPPAKMEAPPKEQDCPPGGKVFMGNLPFDITERDVTKLLQMVQIGESKYRKINIAQGKKTKRPLGWLLIEFKDAETARMCVEATNGIDFMGRVLNVNIKDPPLEVRQPIRDHMVYLSNLDYSLTEIEIYNMCEDLVGPGLVLGVKIPLDKSRDVPRGYAHIEFKDASSVQLAITQLTGVEVFGRILKAEKLGVPSARKVKSGEDEEAQEQERGRV